MAESGKPRFGKYIFLLWLVALSPVLLIATLLFMASQSDLPDTEALANPKTNLATEIISADGKTLGTFYLENRVNVDFDQISPKMIQALVATEDERFYSHSGIDLRGTARAAIYLGKKGGASTITQQLSKMLFTKQPGSGLERVFQKFQEWIIAVRLERQYTKEEILTMYLNKFDWINQAVGIRSASSVYFSTTPGSLKIEEAAMLVGMAKNPALYNPMRRPELAKERRNVVFGQMLRNEFITELEYDSLKFLPLGLDFQRVDHNEGIAPYFREVLRGEVGKMFREKNEQGEYKYAKSDGTPYDLYSDGLKIFTTINSKMQKYGEWAIGQHLRTELQEQFWEDISRNRNAPFSNDLSDEQVEDILWASMRRTQRYRIYRGEECPNCHRRVNIEEKMVNRDLKYECQSEDCKEIWNAVPRDSIMPYFKEPVEMKVFSWRGDIDTTMSPLDSIRYYKSFLQAGLVSIDPNTGFVRAWVGGIDYQHFKYDHVKQGRRQVGSTIKPFVYATAIREGYSPCHQVPKVPTTFHKGTFNLQEDYTPHDPGRDYGYMVSLKWGLANSINTITAWVMKQFGPEAVIKLARDLGIKSPMEPVVSLGFGVTDMRLLEITSANATFANKGVHIKPIYITRIEDKNGNAIFEVMPETNEALDEETAYVMLSLMQGTVDGVYNEHQDKTVGTAVRLRYDLPSRDYDGFDRELSIAAKTGTTQNQSDGWFIGLIPELVTGVWVGAEDRSVHFRTLQLGMGTNMALPIWGYYMKKVYADSTLQLNRKEFEKPDEPINVMLDCDNYREEQELFESEEIQW